MLIKVHIVKAMVFPVVTYVCESGTIKKAECQRIDAFELCYWRRLLRVPWTARRSNQSILKEFNPEYSLEGLMLKLNSNTLASLWEEPTHWKRPWFWERLKAQGEGDDRVWDGWMASSTQRTWVWASSRRLWKPGVQQFMGLQCQTQLSDWTYTQVLRSFTLSSSFPWKFLSFPHSSDFCSNLTFSKRVSTCYVKLSSQLISIQWTALSIIMYLCICLCILWFLPLASKFHMKHLFTTGFHITRSRTVTDT